MKRIFLLVFWVITMLCSCQGQRGPGYDFGLFDKTPNEELAKAVEREDTHKIKEILDKKYTDVNLQEPKFGNTLLMLAVGNDKLKSATVLLEGGANVNLRDYEDNAPINEATKYPR